MNMKRIGVIAIILTLLPAKMLAQTEGNNGVLLGGSSATSSYAPNDILQSDTLKLHLDPQFTTPLQMKEPIYGQHNDFIESSKMGAVGFQLWKNAAIGVAGSTYHLPGLMDISSGALTLHQDLGRWHFTASGMADKYWMPWQLWRNSRLRPEQKRYFTRLRFLLCQQDDGRTSHEPLR